MMGIFDPTELSDIICAALIEDVQLSSYKGGFVDVSPAEIYTAILARLEDEDDMIGYVLTSNVILFDTEYTYDLASYIAAIVADDFSESCKTMALDFMYLDFMYEDFLMESMIDVMTTLIEDCIADNTTPITGDRKGSYIDLRSVVQVA